MKKRRLATGALSIALALTMVSTSAFAVSVEFTDVPSSHWASSSIAEMADKGVVSGTGNNKYSPDLTVSYAQFATMIARSFYNDQIEGDGDKWYSSFMTTAEKAGILEGTKVLGNDALVEAGINRYEMAQVMYNVLQDQLGEIAIDFDTTAIADWASIPDNYKDAVSLCYHYGTLSGTDGKGTFSGTTMMTRAQAAVVMDRLIEVCGGDTPTTPVTPEKPAGTVQILPGDSSITKVSNGTPIEGGYEFDTSGAINAAGSDRTAWMHIHLGGNYSTLTFTVTSISSTLGASVNSRDSSLRPTLLTQEQLTTFIGPGESHTYTVDVSGVNDISLGVGGYIAHATVTNITLS